MDTLKEVPGHAQLAQRAENQAQVEHEAGDGSAVGQAAGSWPAREVPEVASRDQASAQEWPGPSILDPATAQRTSQAADGASGPATRPGELQSMSSGQQRLAVSQHRCVSFHEPEHSLHMQCTPCTF